MGSGYLKGSDPMSGLLQDSRWHPLVAAMTHGWLDWGRR
jgi:hypothetical protein